MVARLLEVGLDSFVGGLSADNYIAITNISRDTATRNLNKLVDKGAMTRNGKLRLKMRRFCWWFAASDSKSILPVQAHVGSDMKL